MNRRFRDLVISMALAIGIGLAVSGALMLFLRKLILEFLKHFHAM